MIDPVVEATQIAQIVSPRLFDVREPKLFDSDRVADSVRVPVEAWVEAAKSADFSFDNLDYWQGQIDMLGLSSQDTAVIYDDGRMTEAARVWFVLQHFGATAVIVNGGWPALKKADIAEATKPAQASGKFVAQKDAGSVSLLDRNAVKASLGDAEVFDARTRAEFSGDDLKSNARGGHLPSARLLPHADLLEDGYLKSAETLRAAMSATGFRPGDHIITHCDGGGRAALAAIAAVRAGFEDVKVYYLSFSDWAKDESCPIERT